MADPPPVVVSPVVVSPVVVSPVVVSPKLPSYAVLNQCVPNPFNPQTTIAFGLPEQMTVNLRIFDISGRKVRTLLAGESLSPGWHQAVWQGEDDRGRTVAAGVYFYRLEAGVFSETKRMTLVK